MLACVFLAAAAGVGNFLHHHETGHFASDASQCQVCLWLAAASVAVVLVVASLCSPQRRPIHRYRPVLVHPFQSTDYFGSNSSRGPPHC